MCEQLPSLRRRETVFDRSAEQLRVATPGLEVGELQTQQHVVGVRRRRCQLAVVGEELRSAARERVCHEIVTVAVAEDDPDRMLYAARNRLYVSANGGVFWRSLSFELPDIDSVAWID